jgi:Ni,Fe-hydrogenase I large subunit
VDARAALRADPAAAARLGRELSDWPTSNPDAMRAVQARFAAVLESDQPGPFATPWPGHPAYQLTPEQSLLLLAHALEALDWQREIMRIHALLGGKDPHPQTFLVGGIALAPPWGGPPPAQNRQHPDVPGRNAPNPLSAEGLALLDETITSARAFVTGVYVPDVRLLVGAYPEWGRIGAGPGNYLSWGDLPESDGREPPLYLPAGRLTGANLSNLGTVSVEAVTETTAHAWYTDDGGDAVLAPAQGVTAPYYTGTLPLTALDTGGRYSWVKAPRYDGSAMETGPLARVLVAYADGRDAIVRPLSELLTAAGVGPEIMPSVLGRMIARALEASAMTTRADTWVWELRSNLETGDVAVVDLSRWDQGSWPDSASGWSAGEGPRGSVAHWVRISNKVVDHYQVVDGSTWNLSPRDERGGPGPVEAALVDTPVTDSTQPLEVLRVVHSFNPCPACAVHVFDPRSGGLLDLRVRATEAIR